MLLLGISGSLRADSHNTGLLRAAARKLPPGAGLAIWDGLADVPPFSEDREEAPAPAAVGRLRRAVAGADGVLISTPEYNASVPASSRTRSTGSRGRWRARRCVAGRSR
jgi:chromate reductase